MPQSITPNPAKPSSNRPAAPPAYRPFSSKGPVQARTDRAASKAPQNITPNPAKPFSNRPAAPPAYQPFSLKGPVQARTNPGISKAPGYGPVSASGPLQAHRIQSSRIFPSPAGPVFFTSTSAIQRRAHGDSVIRNFISANAKDDDETYQAYLARLTGLFKTAQPHHHRDDLKFLRKTLGGHRSLLVSDYNQTKSLDAHFNAHVLGNQVGVGWHSESSHQNGQTGYSYTNWGWIAESKGTYWGDNIVVAGTAKAGNNGVSSFFPATMSIQRIRAEAMYVANVHANTQAGQLIIGRGNKSGILIECLMNGDTITSAYPHMP